jgi:hypothetical protein
MERSIPLDDFALGYALSNIGKLELLKHLASRPPGWRCMETCNLSPPAENTSHLAGETHRRGLERKADKRESGPLIGIATLAPSPIQRQHRHAATTSATTLLRLGLMPHAFIFPFQPYCLHLLPRCSCPLATAPFVVKHRIITIQVGKKAAKLAPMLPSILRAVC